MATQNQSVEQQFVNFYYNIYMTSRPQLSQFYRDHSMLTFEGTQFKGQNNIMEKLNGLPFSSIKFEIITIDAQPSSYSIEGMLISVTGNLQTDNDMKNKYSHCFQLIKDGTGYWILNEIFRLNYG